MWLRAYKPAAWLAAWLATPWALHHQKRICRHGRPLTGDERAIAANMGIGRIDDIHIHSVEQVPNPLKWLFALMEKCGMSCVSQVDGITLGHGIYISNHVTAVADLVAHELIHVRQYEQAGSVRNFLVDYIFQCLVHGYQNAPMEKEARADAAIHVNARQP